MAGDSDLVASNIKSGVNIFGVVGTYEGAAGTFYRDDFFNVPVSGDNAFSLTLPSNYRLFSGDLTKSLLSISVIGKGKYSTYE